jgi:hypothetical protein
MALRARNRTAPITPAGTPYLEFVDTALSLAARRQIFTADEAMELLDGVRNKVHGRHDRGVGDALAGIALSAEDSYRDTPLVESSRVIDSLLDMRLALNV